MDPELNMLLDAIERAGVMNRSQCQQVIEGHLDAAAMVVAELGALAAQGLLQRPDFYGATV